MPFFWILAQISLPRQPLQFLPVPNSLMYDGSIQLFTPANREWRFSHPPCSKHWKPVLLSGMQDLGFFFFLELTSFLSSIPPLQTRSFPLGRILTSPFLPPSLSLTPVFYLSVRFPFTPIRSKSEKAPGCLAQTARAASSISSGVVPFPFLPVYSLRGNHRPQPRLAAVPGSSAFRSGLPLSPGETSPWPLWESVDRCFLLQRFLEYAPALPPSHQLPFLSNPRTSGTYSPPRLSSFRLGIVFQALPSAAE